MNLNINHYSWIVISMKKRYNIELNPPKLSSEQIAKHKDFNALLQQFEAEQPKEEGQPRVVGFGWRTRRFKFAAAAAVLLLFSTVAWQMFQPATNTIAIRHAAPFINPPLEKLQKAFITFEVDAAIGGTFEYGDGTRIVVPPYAFVDKEGKKVLGTVFLMYREFHDYVDIFLSGIPMQYDSSNVQLNMATAGMMEMYALQNTKAVFLKQQNPINIELVSQTTLTKSLDYSVYQLDTTERNWTYQQKDNIDLKLEKSLAMQLKNILAETEIVKELTKIQQEISNLDNKKQLEIAKIEQTIPLAQVPIAPHQPNAANFAFDFDLSAYEVADEAGLKEYNDILWEVSANQETAYKKAISEIVWEDAEVEKIPNGYDYKLTLIHSTETVDLIISPALRGSEYAKARADYENKQRAYEVTMTQRTVQLQPQKEALERELRAEEEKLALQKATYQQRYNRERIIQLRNLRIQEDSIINVKQSIVNRFEVKKFGVWNCDQPLKANQKTLKATFTDESGTPYINYLAFMVNQNTGTVQRFYSSEDMSLAYDSNAPHLMWLVNQEGKIAKFSPEDFKKIPTTASNYTFTFKTIEDNFETEAELRALLAF